MCLHAQAFFKAVGYFLRDWALFVFSPFSPKKRRLAARFAALHTM
jgi:hypothetical protein